MNNKVYEKSFGFNSLIRIFKRNIVSILIFSLICFLTSTLYSFVFLEKKYESSGQLVNGVNVTGTVLNTFIDTFSNEDIFDEVVQKLQEENITNDNGSLITKSQIYGKYSIPKTNNSLYIEIALTCNNKHADIILNKTFDIIINYLQNEAKRGEFSKLSISKSASSPTCVTSSFKLVTIFTLFGFLAALCISVIVDFKYDLIYDIEDIHDLNTNAFELNYSTRRKETNE